jgi:multidrug efflux pump subunit AcrA (membrane-fusion protein)
VTVRVTTQLHRDALVAPRSAVTQNNGQGVLFRVSRASDGASGEQQVAARTTVGLGLQNDNYVEVSGSNLTEGTEIIAAPPTTINDKTPVRTH